MNSANPELSLVIPCRDESVGLAALFDTLLPIVRPVVQSFEIIVVNDGSTDDTLQRLLAIQAASCASSISHATSARKPPSSPGSHTAAGDARSCWTPTCKTRRN